MSWDYGPAISGDSVLPRDEFHLLAALHGQPKSQKAFLVNLASSIWSAYQMLESRTQEPYPDSHSAVCLSNWSLKGKIISVTFNEALNGVAPEFVVTQCFIQQLTGASVVNQERTVEI
ncbi:hypothetical protein K1719_017994 [Acacia pycnantha]|nr:hypothetical protein K1719_017994 [Acacia pycnantha]